ncbi:MAG: hypothetical protein ACC628_12610 [Pirellulaceae bacterium]
MSGVYCANRSIRRSDRRSLSPFFPAVFVVAVCVTLPGPVGGTIYERFESPEPTWRAAEADCARELTEHKRTFNESHSDQGCEYLRIRAGQGTFVYLIHDITPARVIAELTPHVWVKSDRVGIRLMARVILPRSRKANGLPHTAFLPGGIYRDIGAWQQLRVDDILRQLDRQVRILRKQFGSDVDSREAYIDLLVLNAYGGPGVTNLWIDDLELVGHAAARVPARLAGTDVSHDAPPPIRSAIESPQMVASSAQVRLQGSVLMANGRPFFLRMIEHQGESFSRLQTLGFNTILLRGFPGQAQLAEARRLGIWLVAPAPVVHQESTESLDRVLAWSLGDRLTRRDVPATRQRAAELRSMPATFQRPLVAGIVDDGADMEGSADIVMPYRSLFAATALADYWRWLRDGMLRQRPGMPFWAAIDTEIPVELERQIIAISGRPLAPVARETPSLRLMAMEAVAAGARGLCFRSRSRLDAQDPATQLRAATLQWINHELLRIEPWMAGGKYLEEIEVTDAHTSARVLETERARLVVVTRQKADFEGGPVHSQDPAVSFVVHGTPITDQAFRIGAARLHPLRGERGNGVRISLEAPDSAALILLTQDPLAIHHVRQRLAETRSTVIGARQQIAELLLQETKEIDRQLASAGQWLPQSEPWLAEATTHVERGRTLQRTGDAENAGRATLQAMHVLNRIRHAHWERAARSFSSPVASPLIATFRTLPLHWEMVARLRSLSWSAGELPGGRFEDLGHMRSSGWHQVRSSDPGIQKAVELSLQAPRSGRSCLHLQAWADDALGAQRLDNWPITIRSAPVPVRQGDLVHIAGWIRVSRRIRNSGDGLMIFDSSGGPELAQQIDRTDGWQEFSLYRAATQDGSLTVTFALTGLGEAWLDDVGISRVK